ncbi:CYTH domain-containing protein [uncultured Tenacibaculum sp.]|uniref:CYTH domain-containing protein n=1 Tax=uncultured Tenacibaculum sp. TaxID=174713 RepID=UPI0026129A22|nr:CYTH domain-containing protein [uncultured Tenacibaculum sp.]
MSLEIERKFLVKNNSFKDEKHTKVYIKQGFLNSDKERVVRVRLKNDQGYLTIKGKSNTSGTTRFEWEKKIPQKEAQDLFELCEKGIIEKYRYLITIGNHTFEVDEFLDDNKGLLIAEVELSSESENFEKPEWLGKEVTGDIKYYNSNLSKLPFKDW